MSATTGHATETLRDGVAGAIRPLSGAVVAVREAQTAMGLAEHITDAITSAAALIVAIEGLEDATKAVAVAARAVLRDCMEDVGAWNVGNSALTVALADAPRSVVVTDKGGLALLHPELMTKPEPQPDRKAIADALRHGKPVEGASFSGGNHPPVLRITSRKKS